MNGISDIPAMILCGGKGTRLRDVTEQLPKPMVPIGEVPIVVHIMKWYAHFGVRRFILCLGYKKESFIDYFVNFSRYVNDITVNVGTGDVTVHKARSFDWEVTLADTGLESKTGRRVYAAKKYLRGSDNEFFLTYGDGVSDVDIRRLFERHSESGRLFTLTKVKSPTRFGLIETDADGRVLEFQEKTQSDGYVNGGFMCVDRAFVGKYLDGSDVFLEQEPMLAAMRDEQVGAYTHDGFWQCMDTSRDYNLLNELWAGGNAPCM